MIIASSHVLYAFLLVIAVFLMAVLFLQSSFVQQETLHESFSDSTKCADLKVKNESRNALWKKQVPDIVMTRDKRGITDDEAEKNNTYYANADNQFDPFRVLMTDYWKGRQCERSSALIKSSPLQSGSVQSTEPPTKAVSWTIHWGKNHTISVSSRNMVIHVLFLLTYVYHLEGEFEPRSDELVVHREIVAKDILESPTTTFSIELSKGKYVFVRAVKGRCCFFYNGASRFDTVLHVERFSLSKQEVAFMRSHRGDNGDRRRSSSVIDAQFSVSPELFSPMPGGGLFFAVVQLKEPLNKKPFVAPASPSPAAIVIASQTPQRTHWEMNFASPQEAMIAYQQTRWFHVRLLFSSTSSDDSTTMSKDKWTLSFRAQSVDSSSQPQERGKNSSTTIQSFAAQFPACALLENDSPEQSDMTFEVSRNTSVLDFSVAVRFELHSDSLSIRLTEGPSNRSIVGIQFIDTRGNMFSPGRPAWTTPLSSSANSKSSSSSSAAGPSTSFVVTSVQSVHRSKHFTFPYTLCEPVPSLFAYHVNTRVRVGMGRNNQCHDPNARLYTSLTQFGLFKWCAIVDRLVQHERTRLSRSQRQRAPPSEVTTLAKSDFTFSNRNVLSFVLTNTTFSCFLNGEKLASTPSVTLLRNTNILWAFAINSDGDLSLEMTPFLASSCVAELSPEVILQRGNTIHLSNHHGLMNAMKQTLTRTGKEDIYIQNSTHHALSPLMSVDTSRDRSVFPVTTVLNSVVDMTVLRHSLQRYSIVPSTLCLFPPLVLDQPKVSLSNVWVTPLSLNFSAALNIEGLEDIAQRMDRTAVSEMEGEVLFTDILVFSSLSLHIGLGLVPVGDDADFRVCFFVKLDSRTLFELPLFGSADVTYLSEKTTLFITASNVHGQWTISESVFHRTMHLDMMDILLPPTEVRTSPQLHALNNVGFGTLKQSVASTNRSKRCLARANIHNSFVPSSILLYKIQRELGENDGTYDFEKEIADVQNVPPGFTLTPIPT